MATPPRSWTAEDDKTLAELHGQGLSLHAISKQMGRAKRTISDHAAKAGLSFDRAATERATAASVKDAKSRQAKLKLDILTELERARERFGQAVTPRDFQAVGQGFASGMRALADLARIAPDDGGLEHAQSVLGRILVAIELSLVDGGAKLLNPVRMADPETGETVLVHTEGEWFDLRQRQIEEGFK